MLTFLKMKRLLGLCLLFVLFVVAPVLVRSLNPPLNDDVLGLIVFKADIEDPEGKLSSWSEDDDNPCNWVGVKCNPRSNRVVELDLDGFSLNGRLGRGLLQLEFLRKLSLSNNNLTGNLSPNNAHFENLRVLDLSGNSFFGMIPDDFFRQCGTLRVISFAKNKLSGIIPESLSSCSSLAALNLSSNQFSGPLPSGIWSLTGLRSLDLSNNVLEGEIPQEVKGMNNLRAVNLGKNRFSGQIPDGIGSCFLLRSVDLGENSFSGEVPATMQKLSLCSTLNLRRNLFEGKVPEWIGEMKGLEILDLSGNRFSGQVPSSFRNLQNLKVLILSENGLTGSLAESIAPSRNFSAMDVGHGSLTGVLPAWILKLGSQNVLPSDIKRSSLSTTVGKAFVNLQVLDLSHNAFSGEISPGIGILSNLQVLNLCKNSFVGAIPESIGGLKALVFLDLSENQLNGSIPEALGGDVSLKELRLEKNLLEGEVPNSIGNCSSLVTLDISENRLTGFIPAALSQLTNLQIVDLSTNNLSGALPKQLANLPNLVLFNISHNNLQGELPAGAFFNTISPSSVAGNPSLCGSIVKKSCPGVLPKPIVLNPNSSSDSASPSLPSSLGHKKIILSISALIAIGAAAVILVGVVSITVLNFRVRSSANRPEAAITFSGGDDEFSNSPTTDANSGKLVMFSGEPDFSTGAHALLNKDCELGRGGFGAVYQTVLRDGQPVAIKKLTVSSLVKSQDDFEREVKKLGKVRHHNLVALEGYYWTPSLQLLIYEFVSGGSLYKQLHEGLGGNILSWNERFNIVLGTAKSLAHLHQMNIIHYNIKSSNVLIDSSGEPKVGDFGLARLLPMLDRYVLSSKIQSALGYMAPEFACKTVKITEKCDVYGFGVLVLEVLTGKRPVEYMEDDVVVLCDMVRRALEEGRVEECIDERLQRNFPSEEAVPVVKLGLICTSQVPSNRPDMAEVVNILELIRCPSEGQEELG